MPQFYASLPDHLRQWILQQPLFFVASAPLTGKHINVSPKGHPSRTLRIINPNLVAYLDGTGSGCETISHVYENGRVTLMCNSFGPSPRILRLFCRGEVAEKGSQQYDELLQLFDSRSEPRSEDDNDVNDRRGDEMLSGRRQPERPPQSDWQTEALLGGARSIILLHVFKVQTSCGYGVPKLNGGDKTMPLQLLPDSDALEKASWIDRDTMPDWASKKGSQIADYRVKNNARSLDGLPGLRSARRDRREWMGMVEVQSWARRVFIAQAGSVLLGMIIMYLALVVGKTIFAIDVTQWVTA